MDFDIHDYAAKWICDQLGGKMFSWDESVLI